MKRYDEGLAFMLKYENVAWYEKGIVKILDRRVYPREIKFVYCKNYLEVKKAIKDMVTQSAGPTTAAGMGMALAAYECRGKSKDFQIEFMKTAMNDIASARPTTEARMKKVTKGCLDVFLEEMKTSNNFKGDEIIFNYTFNKMNNRYRIMTEVAKNFEKLVPSKGKIMTQCFGETIIGTLLRELKDKNKDIEFFTPETRPYLQGSRLTASVIKDQGFNAVVITDNMPGFIMKEKNIDIFTSAADAITLDGHVVNKIGTMQISILSKYFGVPYLVTGIPDISHINIDNIKIEYRDSSEVLKHLGTKVTLDGVQGIYPSFDITPPNLVSKIITDIGVFNPSNINDYFRRNEDNFY